MADRLNLDGQLKALCKHVYFQPPANVKLVYPCIVYKLANEKPIYANDGLYRNKNRYSVTAIDRDPDSKIPVKIRGLRYCRFDRFFTSENLNHFVFEIYD